MRLGLCALLLLSVVSCTSKKGGSSSDLSKIIGENQLLSVDATGSNIDVKYRQLLDAFGNMDIGCTVTHVGNGIGLTAGHCFQHSTGDRSYDLACDNAIRFGDRPGNESKTVYCSKILVREESTNGDYAVIRLSEVPAGVVQIDLTPPAIGDVITIFGHPQHRSLEWSDRCTIESSEPIGGNAAMFAHQCDTEPGNSGSTILNDQTLKIIGIHQGGIVPWNQGTKVSAINIASFLPPTTQSGQPTPPQQPNHQQPQLPSIGVVGATPFAMVAGSGFYTREGTEIHYYNGNAWSEIGVMDANPTTFAMVASGTVIYTRENNEIYRRKNGTWSKIGDVGTGEFQMTTYGEALVVRQGSDLRLYDGTWKDIGIVGATPFQMAGDPSTTALYTREGNEIHQYKNGTWKVIYSTLGTGKFDMVPGAGGLFTREAGSIYYYGASRAEVGVVGAEPFVMAGSSAGLVTREGGGLHTYFNGNWKEILALSATLEFDMAVDGTKVFVRQGLNLIRAN